MQLALYQPDIPQNLGSILRLCACMEVSCHIIEPCGFLLDDKRLKRVAMDYAVQADVRRHSSWNRFYDEMRLHAARIVLLTTKASHTYYEYAFAPTDVLLLGRESAGVPLEVAEIADAKIKVPMAEGARSLNIVQAASVVLGEALRQVKWTMPVAGR